jgi:hypothetical protein
MESQFRIQQNLTFHQNNPKVHLEGPTSPNHVIPENILSTKIEMQTLSEPDPNLSEYLLGQIGTFKERHRLVSSDLTIVIQIRCTEARVELIRTCCCHEDPNPGLKLLDPNPSQARELALLGFRRPKLGIKWNLKSRELTKSLL